MCYIRHLRPCLPNQILRCDPDLQAPLSGAYINIVELFGGVVDVGREMLFHADGGAAATDVAGEGEEFFDRIISQLLLPSFCAFLQSTSSARDDTDKVAAFVAVQDKRLEYPARHLANWSQRVVASDRFHLLRKEPAVSHFGFASRRATFVLFNFHRY